MERNVSSVWRIIAIVAIIALVAVSAYACIELNKDDSEKKLSGEEILDFWTKDSESKEKLIGYIEDVTDEKSKDYIPVENRIAVFDFDGTLFCETDPNYFDYTMLVYRVLEDPDYKDKASDFEKEVAEEIVELNRTGKGSSDLPTRHGQAVASAFKGMTLEELDSYIQKFKATPMPSYDGMNRGDGWYLPMKQVISYLQEYDFTVYIVSGTDRFLVRSIVNGSNVDLPNHQIIGSDENTVATGQDGIDGLDYTYKSSDEVVLGGEFIIKNLKMNKVSVIVQEIGVQPVLSFGNTTGDAAMAMYTITDNQYKSMAFMVCCDDIDREHGNISKADNMYSLCEQYNWVPISMKNDWTTIYGDDVTYKGN